MLFFIEHSYHTVYSYSKADWDGLKDIFGMCLYLISLSVMVTYAAKEITKWVKIGVDCYIPHRKFQLKPHSFPWCTPCAVVICTLQPLFPSVPSECGS